MSIAIKTNSLLLTVLVTLWECYVDSFIGSSLKLSEHQNYRIQNRILDSSDNEKVAEVENCNTSISDDDNDDKVFDAATKKIENQK